MKKQMPKATPDPSFHGALLQLRDGLALSEDGSEAGALAALYALGCELEAMAKRGATRDELAAVRFELSQVARFAIRLDNAAYELMA